MLLSWEEQASAVFEVQEEHGLVYTVASKYLVL